MPEKSWRMADFEVQCKIGEGKIARVYKAVEKASRKTVALKVFPKAPINQFGIHHQLRREIEIQHHLNFKHIVRLHGYFQTETDIVLVMEYFEARDLYSRTQKKEKIELKPTLFQLAKALQYMHLRNVIHRDIKLENILLSSTGLVKVIDFGWAVHCVPDAQRETYCGTVLYLSPELLNTRRYDEKVDVWAFGVVAYELVCGVPPFFGKTENETFGQIKSKELASKGLKTAGAEAEDLIRKCLEKDPLIRIGIEDVVKHPFFEGMNG